MKKITTRLIGFALLLLFMCNCTGKFEEYNTNPYQPTELNPRLLFNQIITIMSSVKENPAQRNLTFWSGPFGGMLTPSSSWGRSQHFQTYNVDDDWNKGRSISISMSYIPAISPSRNSPTLRGIIMHLSKS